MSISQKDSWTLERRKIQSDLNKGEKNPMFEKDVKDFMTEEEIVLWKRHISESGKGKSGRKKGDSSCAKNFGDTSGIHNGRYGTHLTAWNKGLSADPNSPNYDKRVAASVKKSGESQKGRIPWNKGLTKVSDAQVANIRVEYKNGESRKNLSIKYKISISQINSIISECQKSNPSDFLDSDK
jgi:hypothetical protein